MLGENHHADERQRQIAQGAELIKYEYQSDNMFIIIT